MSVPSTREPQEIPDSQIIRGLNVGFSCSSKQLPLKAGACGRQAKRKGAGVLRPNKERKWRGSRSPERKGLETRRYPWLRLPGRLLGAAAEETDDDAGGDPIVVLMRVRAE